MKKKAAQIIGYKNSGKTSLILSLCSIFKQKGLKVGCIKYAHHGLDKVDTDTEKMAREANIVAGLSHSSSQIFFSEKKGFLDILSFFNVDVILIEGGKGSVDFIPNIVTVGEKEDVQLKNDMTIGIFDSQKSSVEDIAELILDKGFILPGINCGACGCDSCREMGIKILRKQASIIDCITLTTPDVEVTVDGEVIKMNPFVQDIVKSTINGMLSPLKGYHKGDIVIKIRKL